MKKILVFILFILICSISYGKLNDDLRIKGSGFNNWAEYTMSYETLAGGTKEFWFTTLQSNSTGNAYLFGNWSWGNTWKDGSGNANVKVDVTWQGSSDCTINSGVTSGNYYTFRFKDNGYNNTISTVLETSESPISINGVSFIYNGVDNDATVDITLSGSKCDEENVYVRYTDNTGSWASDGFALATGSGTSYSAIIPGSAVSTSTQFYVLTTTLTSTGSSDLDNYPDLMTINYSNNGGNNWTLPVELSTFTAQYHAGKPLLYWTTQSETDNMGWFVYRNKIEDFTSATKVSGMIEGHGTTTQAQSYIYEDVIADPQVDDVYYYWLESIDYSGTIHHFDKVAMITIPDINNPNPNVTTPQVYDLLASPNPFNESTKISFTLTQSAMVDVAIYDVKGALVKSFDTQHVTANDEVLLKWYGNDENSKSLSNGIYLYSVKVNGQEYSTKQLILMK